MVVNRTIGTVQNLDAVGGALLQNAFGLLAYPVGGAQFGMFGHAARNVEVGEVFRRPIPFRRAPWSTSGMNSTTQRHLLRDLLDGPHTAVIATSNGDGRPQSSVIFVKRDGHTVVFSTIKGRLKTTQHGCATQGSACWSSTRIRGATWETRGTGRDHGRPRGATASTRCTTGTWAATRRHRSRDAERLIVRITPERVCQFSDTYSRSDDVVQCCAAHGHKSAPRTGRILAGSQSSEH